jgi:hypothetical protein
VRHDPLFDQPYEPAPAAQSPAQAEASAAAPAPRTGSPTSKPRKKVAALLGGSR